MDILYQPTDGEILLISCLMVLYIAALFTISIMTIRKGHLWLGIIGMIFPLLWLIGAILPAKEGSRYDIEKKL